LWHWGGPEDELISNIERDVFSKDDVDRGSWATGHFFQLQSLFDHVSTCRVATSRLANEYHCCQKEKEGREKYLEEDDKVDAGKVLL
jgi:hypothetical protein